jgi:hypothetical protein
LRKGWKTQIVVAAIEILSYRRLAALLHAGSLFDV